MKHPHRKSLSLGLTLFTVALMAIMAINVLGTEPEKSPGKPFPISDHFDGKLFFNPWVADPAGENHSNASNRGVFWYLWRWVFSNERPEWPKREEIAPGPAPTVRVPDGSIRVTTIGHASFLIQMDGVNILTDPIWSKRCSPVSWVGPKRHQPPGLRFDDLPQIDMILISHNHYDHLDLPTLKRLADKDTPRALVPLGNRELVLESGIPQVEEKDWWESVSLSPKVKVTLVPAQHFSARTPWDRNKTLWGGFVISGPSGKVYFAGDTAYGPHLLEIGRRFVPIRLALLPISPFRTGKSNDLTPSRFSIVHLGPVEAVRAHMDLEAEKSIAAHFRVFRLGWDGFDDAVNELASAIRKQNLRPEVFPAPSPGQVFESGPFIAEKEVAGRPRRSALGG
ncbi:MAG: MBL fold metallo-hydrolase [Thermodesulfobacteriota bacterium]